MLVSMSDVFEGDFYLCLVWIFLYSTKSLFSNALICFPETATFMKLSLVDMKLTQTCPCMLIFLAGCMYIPNYVHKTLSYHAPHYYGGTYNWSSSPTKEKNLWFSDSKILLIYLFTINFFLLNVFASYFCLCFLSFYLIKLHVHVLTYLSHNDVSIFSDIFLFQRLQVQINIFSGFWCNHVIDFKQLRQPTNTGKHIAILETS